MESHKKGIWREQKKEQRPGCLTLPRRTGVPKESQDGAEGSARETGGETYQICEASSTTTGS